MGEEIFPIPETWPGTQVSASFFACLPSESVAQATSELKQREHYVRDVMNSNRKFDVSFDGTLLSNTKNLNAFVLTPTVQICRVRAVKEI